MLIEPLLTVGITDVGAVGTLAGITFWAADAGPSPTPLVATTVTVYEVPLDKPLIKQLLASPLFWTQVTTEPPVPVGEALTVYLVIVAPPESTGAFQVTETPPFRGVSFTPTGAPGADLGVVEIALDETDVPASLTAVTVID
jgi:hypothetical protein